MAIDLNDAETWTAAFAKVNCWRGEGVQAFADVEAAVSQTLLSLHARQPDIDLPLLVGLRFKSMEKALAASAVEPPRLSAVQQALTNFSPQHNLRASLPFYKQDDPRPAWTMERATEAAVL